MGSWPENIHLVNRLSKELKAHNVISLDPSVLRSDQPCSEHPAASLWALENLGEGNIVNRITIDDTNSTSARVPRPMLRLR